MHVVFRESAGLDQQDAPRDLAQDPADLVVLSFSDGDLGAFAEGWRGSGLPSLRLANLSQLRHPLSVDTYVENTLEGAKAILVRLIGGVPYWEYGLQQLKALATRTGCALAVLPGDRREDPRLDAASTLPVSTLRRLQHLCDQGGAGAARAALAQLSLAAGLYARPMRGASAALPSVGAWTPEEGLHCTALLPGPGAVPVVFYRAFLTAADLAPVEAMIEALRARGLFSYGLFVPSLKAPEAAAWLARQMQALKPAAIVNATAFSGIGASGASPLDAAGVSVVQVALATSTRAAWAEAERGLSPQDLAMHVVLPEVDGRLFAGVVSFKEPQARDEALQWSRLAHTPVPDRIAVAAERVAGMVRLGAKSEAERRVAVVLSTYPGKGWNRAHAVGLDAVASAEAILADLAEAGYEIGEGPGPEALGTHALEWPLAEYEAALEALPQTLRDDLTETWGRPADDPAARLGMMRFAALRRGNLILALQPERGMPEAKEGDYHDLSRTPRHAYVAFYLWLRRQADAMVHVGAHGTLEWLPGKAVALSEACWPEALTGAMPTLYPFIVNDPGEAAQAKRRLGAVALGHAPPPLARAETPAHLIRLEALLDEFSNADGLDPARRARLQGDIRSEAAAHGLDADLGIPAGACASETIAAIDRFVCDLKESQFGDGLHVWGRSGPSPEGERDGLLAALSARRVAPGPAGSPHRGRTDVIPTGRNMFAVDPRSVPSRSAHAQGIALAEELMRRHLQDEGDWPKGLVVDLWGSATMRTAGEEFAMALHLIGAKPVWDEGSERVSGVEILPIADLDRPRIDVTLRVSGLFRDVFPGLPALFGQAVRMLGARDEAPDWNPYVSAPGPRVYGPAPGAYGFGMGDTADASPDEAARAWLAASDWAHDEGVRDAEGIRDRVRAANAYVHLQDLPETDLLLADDYAAHEGGFAAAKAQVGGTARLWHLDATRPDAPKARALSEELARIVRARAANPAWIAGMRRHGFRGVAEIAATLEHMAAFSRLTGVLAPHLVDLFREATLGDPETLRFLEEANPGALQAMHGRFEALAAEGRAQVMRNVEAAE